MLAWALGEAEAKASNGHDVMRGNALTGEKMGRKSETQGEPLDHASLTLRAKGREACVEASCVVSGGLTQLLRQGVPGLLGEGLS